MQERGRSTGDWLLASGAKEPPAVSGVGCPQSKQTGAEWKPQLDSTCTLSSWSVISEGPQEETMRASRYFWQRNRRLAHCTTFDHILSLKDIDLIQMDVKGLIPGRFQSPCSPGTSFITLLYVGHNIVSLALKHTTRVTLVDLDHTIP